MRIPRSLVLAAAIATIARAAILHAQTTGSVNSVAGSFWTYLGATYGTGWVFTPPPPNSGVSPLTYGAKADGITNDTTAVQQAIDAAAHNTLFLGPHVYKVGPLSCNAPVNIIGTQSGGGYPLPAGTGNYSGFVAAAPNETLLTINASYTNPGCAGSKFQDFVISMGGANTAGWAIQAPIVSNDANPVLASLTFQGVQIDGGCGGLDLSGFYLFVDHVKMSNMGGGANCDGIRLGHLSNGAATIDPIITNTHILSVPTGALLNNGMLIEDAGGLMMSHNDINFANIGTAIAPGPAQHVEFMFWRDTVLGDNTKLEALFIDTKDSSAYVRGLECIDCWAAASLSSSGIVISNEANAANFVGFHFVAAHIYQNWQNGVLIAGGRDITFDNSYICSNNIGNGGSAGIVATAGVNSVRIRGGNIGGGGIVGGTNSGNNCDTWTNTQATGIVFAGPNTDVLVQGVDLATGNTVPIAIGTGVTGRIEGNPGYNPVGAGPIAVTASPFIYTAGLTTEHVCTMGGTVSGVVIGGQTVAVATNNCTLLAPGQSMVVTYTAAPTMSRSLQ